MFRKWCLSAAIALATLFSLPSHAATLAPDGNWATFSFGGVGSSWSDHFSFTLEERSTIQITDFLSSGDQFEIFLNGWSIGQTSAPTVVGAFTADMERAVLENFWSSMEFSLSAGSYLLSGRTTASPFAGGTGALRIVSDQLSAVPLPTSFLLLLTTLLGTTTLLRRKAS